MRPRSLATLLAIIAALVGVVALIAIAPSLFSARGRLARVYIFSDDQHPNNTTLLLHISEALPFLGQRMICDGVTLSYGAPQWQSLLGYYGDVRTRPAGQSYHCVLHDWQGKAALDIPASAAPSYARFVSPSQHAQLSRNEPVDVALAFAADAPQDGAPAMFVEARDGQGHSWVDDSYGAGGYRGHATFKPVANRGLVTGPGALVAQYQINQHPTVPGWQGVELWYRPAIALPITWV
jgi:hypothetical protein